MTLMVSFVTILVYVDLYLMLRDPFMPVKKRKVPYRIAFGIWVGISLIYTLINFDNYRFSKINMWGENIIIQIITGVILIIINIILFVKLKY